MEKALAALATAARIAGIPADPESLCRAFPSRDLTSIPFILLRAAKKTGLKAKRMTTSAERLDRLPQPSLLLLPDGDVLIFLKAEAAPDGSPETREKGRVLLLRPAERKPFVWSFEQLGAVWEGDAIPLARRFSFAELGRKFSIGWFLPVILRFRRHLVEVFVGSFFLQTFGLITPLFSQVIIDKVLIHKGLSTLDVLVLGLFLINSSVHQLCKNSDQELFFSLLDLQSVMKCPMSRGKEEKRT